MKRLLRKHNLIFLLTIVFLLSSAGTAFAADTHIATVNQNTRIDVQIVDQDGRAVAPGQPIDNISYIIKSKPEGAKVSAYTANDSDLEQSGKLTMGFTCDKPGTVEVQTFIRMKNAAKYYTGVHTISVVPEKSEESKIVIMSVGSKQIIVNNDVVHSDAAPVIHNSRTYVPLRVLSDIFGAQCSYDSNAQQVTVTKSDNTIVMTIDGTTYTLNGNEHQLDAPAYVTSGRTMVPVRFIAEAFGIVVKPTYTESGAVADIMFQM